MASSVLLAGNEVGTVQDLDGVRAVVDAEAPGAVLHTDAVQAFAWLDVAPSGRLRPTWSRSAATSSAGPSGVGVLVVRGAGPRSGRCSSVAARSGVAAAARCRSPPIVGPGRRRPRLRGGPQGGRRPRRVRSATGWPTGCSPPSPARSRPATARTRSRRTATSASRGSRPRRCSSCSTRKACARPRRRRARVARPSRRTCSPRSACPPRPGRRVAAALARVDHHRRPMSARALEVVPDGRGPVALVKVLVAMSGGVDSSVAAALLADAGPRRDRRDAAAVGRRVRLRLLLGVRRRRRPPGRRPPRARPPRLQLRPGLRAPRRRALRRATTAPVARRTRASSATGT